MQAQKNVIAALMEPEAYEGVIGSVKVVQTHISFVFLTETFVYKVKKAVNFGFLDFSTLEKRRFFCEKELDLNRRLCEDMYLEVVPINLSADNSIKINGPGETVEYALKMRRLPQEKIMSTLIEKNQVDKALIDRIAKIIADFHSKAQTNSYIGEFGSLTTIKVNWDENFDQTKDVIGKTISKADYDFIQSKVNNFMETNQALFEKRVVEGKIKDCHGDIHSGNIFVTDKIYIFDAIEFNDRFRYSDTTSDIAFLAMDLDYKHKPDLSNYLINRYVEYSKDTELAKLLPFYKCYRAYVRGKVTGFKLNDSNINPQEKTLATQEAKTYFNLATTYAKQL